jgi:oligoendopeptidase F
MVKATMPANRPTDQREDPGVYGNAILRAGRMLHNDYMVAHASTSQARTAYLIFGLDALATTFEDALRAEFAWEAERRIAAGVTPTGDELSSRYGALLREYYGGEDGYRVPGYAQLAWMSEPYLFYGYINQHFPPATAAASLLIERLRKGDAPARRAFDGVRGRLDSDFSYDLLAACNIDLASAAPYQALFRRMDHLMTELEASVN